MTTHSTLSPSARARWGNCPGSVREEKAYPSQPSGPAAIDGTHSHTLLELCIKNTHDATAYIGQTLRDHDGEFIVDAERAERVQFAINYIEQRITELDCDKVISEVRVRPDSLVGRSDMSGTVDVQLLTPDVIEMIDYKDGMAPVDAKDNPQLEQYAVGVVAEMQNRGERAPLFIHMTIVQPKLRIKGMKGISTHKITLGELMQAKEKMIEQAAATDKPDALLVPGEAQCKYCAHRNACSARANGALAAAGVVFSNLDTAKQSAEKEPTTMSDQQLREIIEAAPMLRQMIEGAEAEALKRLEAGTQIEGLKAVRGRGSRGWAVTDETEMADKLKKFGLPKDVIWATKLITVAQAEKAQWEKRDGTKVQLTERQLKTLKTEYTKTSEGKITVTTASDPRPAVTLSVAPMFQAIEPVVTFELPSFLL